MLSRAGAMPDTVLPATPAVVPIVLPLVPVIPVAVVAAVVALRELRLEGWRNDPQHLVSQWRLMMLWMRQRQTAGAVKTVRASND